MSRFIQFPLMLITAFGLFAAEPADPPLFQIRLVQDKPGDSAEPMTITRHIKDQDRIIEEVVYVLKKVLMDHTAIESAALEWHPITGEPQIGITFTKSGANLLAKITREHVNKRLALIVDGRVLSAPIIRTEISGGKAAISGNLSEEEAAELAKKINAAEKKGEGRVPQTVSWKQAVELIRGGNIQVVGQTHSLDVWMKSKDGQQYKTREPKIDAVLDVIEEVDPERRKIRFFTE